MPHGKHYKKLRRRRQWRNFKGYTTSALGLASKALGVANQVKKLVNAEMKYVDYNLPYTANTPGTASSIFLTGIAEGTGSQQRTGISIKSQSNSLKLTSTLPNSSAHSIVRITLIRDNNNDGGSPAESDLYEDPTDLASPYNKANIGARFQVMYDKYVLLNTGMKQVDFDSTYRKLNYHMKYSNSLASVADAKSDQLFLFIRSVSDSAATVEPTVQINNRFQFTDN